MNSRITVYLIFIQVVLLYFMPAIPASLNIINIVSYVTFACLSVAVFFIICLNFRNIKIERISILILAFFTLSFISVYNVMLGKIPLNDYIRGLIPFCWLIYYFFFTSLFGKEEIEKVINLFYYVCLAFSVTIIVYYFIYVAFNPYSRVTFYYLNSTLPFPMFATLIAVYRIATKRRILDYILLLIHFTAIVFTETKSLLLCTIVSLVLLLTNTKFESRVQKFKFISFILVALIAYTSITFLALGVGKRWDSINVSIQKVSVDETSNDLAVHSSAGKATSYFNTEDKVRGANASNTTAKTVENKNNKPVGAEPANKGKDTGTNKNNSSTVGEASKGKDTAVSIDDNKATSEANKGKDTDVSISDNKVTNESNKAATPESDKKEKVKINIEDKDKGSISARLNEFSIAIKELKNNILLGNGLGYKYNAEALGYGSDRIAYMHNIIAYFLLDFGIMGVIFLGVFLVEIFKVFLRNRKSSLVNIPKANYNSLIACLILSFLAYTNFFAMIRNIHSIFIFILFLSALVIINKEEKANERLKEDMT
ncbi:MAG: O-antigen ligase family protein [Clostridia bacterium]|nr:O-antigen ligase family protein [Clostridia bacterium]